MGRLITFVLGVFCICLCEAFVLEAVEKSTGTSAPPKTNDGCPSQLYNGSTTMIIYSPNYPNEYANNQKCVYLIIVPGGNVVRLRFTALYTEYKYDKIEIFDGQIADNHLLATYSGAEIPDDIHSTSNVMSLRFTTDATYTYRGFAATYFATVPPNGTTGEQSG